MLCVRNNLILFESPGYAYVFRVHGDNIYRNTATDARRFVEIVIVIRK